MILLRSFKKDHSLLFFYFVSCFLFFSFSIFIQKTSHFSTNIGIDDANIFFVFAKNFYHGNGFVWHVEDGPVEGFTSFLWEIVCISCFYFSNNPERTILVICLFLMSFSSAIFLESCIYLITKNQMLIESNFKKIAILFCFFLWCLLSDGFLTWNLITLMDTCLWTSFLMLIVACFILDFKHPFFLLLSILPFVRPEGLVFLVAAFLVNLIIEFHSKHYLCFSMALNSIAIGFLLLLPTSLLTIFRITYFGFPFPNTFYAKVGSNLGDQIQYGLEYFWTFLVNNPIMILVFFLSVFITIKCLILPSQSKQSFKIMLVTSWVLIGFVLYVVLGGDHFPLHRQYQAFWILSFIVLLYALKSNLKYVFPILAISLASKLFFVNPSREMYHEFKLASWGREAGHMLNEIFDLDKLWTSAKMPNIATFAIGGVGFTYRGKIVDLLGLANVEMAHATTVRRGFKNHAAFDIDTFYKILPEMILYFGPDCEKRENLSGDIFINYVLKNLPKEKRFIDKYKIFMIPNKNNTNLPVGICGFIRKDMIRKFNKERSGRYSERYIYSMKN